jgi:hypothetical protein
MKIIELLLEEEQDGIQAISLVSEPAIEENWVALSDVKLKAIDTERRIVMGAALVPNKPILRRNGDEEFYIYFSEDTIRKAAEGYLKAGHQKQSNVEHEMAVTGVTTIESWIVEDSQIDKSAVYNLKVDKGTWMVSMKVDNDAVWEEFIKTGRLKGFSIEGKFTQRIDGSSAPADLIEQSPNESDPDFIERCMSEMAEEFPDEKQRYAVCRSFMEMERALSDIEKEIS